MSASILAGGKSSRMGTDKALLKFGGKNFLETLLHTLSMFKNVMISTAGSGQYEFMECRRAPDLYPGAGPIGGIYSSLASCEDDYLFVTACDTPFLSGRLIKNICEAAGGFQCFIAAERGGLLHPLCGVYHRSVIPTLRELINSGRYKIAPVYDLVKTGYFVLSAEQEAELRNFNTKEEYEKIMRHIEKQAPPR
jgi:molybdopterin-guanine dinucleotide biosynthesis protein A